MRTLLFISSFAILLYGCKKNTDLYSSISADQINTFKLKYFFGKEKHSQPTIVGAATSFGDTAFFEYKDNKINKRIGGAITGFAAFYSKNIIDTVQYESSNRIILITKSYEPGLSIPGGDKREFAIDNGLISKKTTLSYIDPTGNDTLYYYYDAAKKLIRTEQRDVQYLTIKNYQYDAANNLQKIIGSTKFIRTVTPVFETEETFSDYDNAPNPIKGIMLWEDMLYRSLSTNNFRTYNWTQTDFLFGSGYPPSLEYKSWGLFYDNNGKVDFSK